MSSHLLIRGFLTWLALAFCNAAMPVAQGAFIAEGAFDAAVRSTYLYNAPGPPPFTLTRGGELQAGYDARGTGYYEDSGLKFALGSVIIPGQTITGATLTLNVALFSIYSSISTIAVGLTAFGTTNAALTLADFAGSQMPAGSTTVTGVAGPLGYLSGSDTGYPLAPVTFDVTTVLRSLYANGATSVGFVLTNTSSNALYFSPPDASTPSYRPQLIIVTNTIPAPPAAVLVVLGLLGVGPLARLSRKGR